MHICILPRPSCMTHAEMAFINSPKEDTGEGDSTRGEIEVKLTTRRLKVLMDLISPYVALETMYRIHIIQKCL